MRDLPQLGAPRKIILEDESIRRKSVTNPNKNATEICKSMIIETWIHSEQGTIRRRLDAAGLYA